jgi:outer membrane protein
MKRYCLKALLRISLGVFLMAAASFGYAGTKVGYVQMKIIMQSQQSLNVGNKLMAEFKPRNAELEKFKKQILDKEMALEKEAPNLSQREYTTKRQELDYQKIELDRKKARQHEDFLIRKQEELNNFQNSVNAAVTNVGQSEGYDLILYNTGGYIGPRVDVTDKVLKLLK